MQQGLKGSIAGVVAAATLLAGGILTVPHAMALETDGQYYSSKQPYVAPSEATTASYSQAPEGYETVYTESMARHGSRGLSSYKYDALLMKMAEAAEADNGFKSDAIKSEFMKNLKAITAANVENEEQLYETAIKNSNVLEPPSIDRLTNVMADLMRAQGMDEDIIENQLKEDDIDMYVISNTTKANGASVIVYSDALQQVAENLGSDLYILPSSIHEVLALPVGNKDVDSLEEMVRCVNQTEVSPTEVLSDNVYKYDAESRTLSLASAKAETVKETAVCEPSGYTGTVNEVARPRHHR